VQQDEERVTARLRGADSAEGTLTARWMVGCDGTKSAVRAGAGISFDGETYPELARLLRLRDTGSGAATAGADEHVKLFGMTRERQKCCLCCVSCKHVQKSRCQPSCLLRGRSKASDACLCIVCGS